MASGTGETVEEAVGQWASRRFAERHSVESIDPGGPTEGDHEVSVKLVRTGETERFTLVVGESADNWVVRDA
ncbi:hypothetical protein [Halomarina oriensis]|uniref:Uncharacterized protein n=1 Tax=Halomarina oriensis TaxID=671145 RepID=A0A6B0GFJ5_9EURY|nr:hypothetical protein [Halomarina oriensis]MWG33592.1 hypothetical protein [Halomarina oriensis]